MNKPITKKKTISQRELISKSNLVFNNPRSNLDFVDKKGDKWEKDHTLYDNKMGSRLDKILEARKRMKEKEDTASRMIKGYNKNKNKIDGKPEKEEPSQSELRKRKLADLLSRKRSWKGLESYDPLDDILEEDFNKFISMFRKYHSSGRLMRFREWLDIMDNLIDQL
jgi:hypothetical protein